MRSLRIATLLLAMLGIAPAVLATGQSDYATNCARSGCHSIPTGTPPSFSGVSGLSVSLPTSITRIQNAGMTFGLPTTTLQGIVDYLDGVAAAPVAGLTPTALSFGNQQVGTTSAAQTITLSNSGTAALNLSAIATALPFTQTNNCGTSVAAGASCSISVSFAPTAAAAATGSLTITDDAAASPQSIALTGTGTPAATPAATVAPTSLTFGSTTIGASSASQAVKLSNSGNAVLSVTSIASSGAFAQTNNCGATIAAGASCTINVIFTPTATGAAAGTLTITDVASGSPQSVALSGTGAASAAPAVGLSPISLIFAAQQIGTTSAAQPITLHNSGNAALAIASITASAPFMATHSCGTSLAAGASCTIQASFAPTASGTASGTVSIADNAAGSPHAVALSGTGSSASAPSVTLSASNLSFGNQAVGTTSAAQTLTITDSGSGALNLTSLAASGNFAIAGGTCSTAAPVAAGANCTVQLTFSPTATGTSSGLLMITDNAGGSPRTVTLQGTGTSTSASSATLQPSTVSFAPQLLNSTGAAHTVSLTNTSATAALALSGIAISGANASDFSQTSTCGSSLATGASCMITVQFKPQSAGTRSAMLAITSNAGGALSTSLTGTGLAQSAAVLSFGTGTLSFRAQTVGTTSRPRWVSLSNTGSATLHIASLTLSGDFVRVGSSCRATLAPHSHCGVAIEFKPTAAGVRSGALQVASDTSGIATSVTLAGTGAASGAQPPQNDDGNDDKPSASGAPQIELETSTTLLSFDAAAAGASSAPLAAYVTNSGSAAGTLAQVAVSGSGFALAADQCSGKTLAVSESCSVSVAHSSAADNGTGTLSVATTTGTMRTIALEATSTPATTAAPSAAADSGASSGGGAIGGWGLLLLAALALRKRAVPVNRS